MHALDASLGHVELRDSGGKTKKFPVGPKRSPNGLRADFRVRSLRRPVAV